MKFYYEGKLIRTSKTHHYTHAIVCEGTAIMCSATRQGCEREKQRYLSQQREIIKSYQDGIKYLRDGKKGYYVKDGRSSYYVPFDKYDTAERYEKWIKESENRIQHITNNWKIVEIEER